MIKRAFQIITFLVSVVVLYTVSGMDTLVDPMSTLLAFTSAAAVGVFLCLYQANKAAQLDPIEALLHGDET